MTLPAFVRAPEYPALLEQAWQAAKAPRASDAPTVISTFSGRGGSSIGYHMAGFRELLAVEWDGHAADTLRLNWSDLDVYHGDIAALGVDEVLSRAGLRPGELDLFEGSPPCQGFSTAGRRQLDDPRNQLFREYVRLLAGLQPKTFIMENVEGMTFGSMAGIYGEALGALQDAGYVVVSGVLNAGYLGVPQLRKRLIVVGVREDLGLTPTLPVPMQKPITVREAWHGLPDTPEGFTLTRPEWLTVYARTAPGRSFKDLHPNKAFFSHVRLSYDRPSPTIVKTIGVSRSGEPHGGFYHPRWPRLLTIPEAKRLSSFPDAYRFAETGDPVDDYLQAWAGLGNSVPPLMTRAIAQHLRATVLDPLSGA